ncbi:MAG: hypothetical protein J0M00_17770 [Burkholderiales bacterium]|nr:hypothetical protein [Burkholderiales bacterium]
MPKADKSTPKTKDRAARAKAKPRRPRAAAPAEAECGHYEDGTPFDKITYLEAKLILKPDRFTSVQSFRQFGALVQRIAARTGVGFIPDPKASQRPEVREILFFDTPDYALYNNAFILRRRVTYVDGFPVGDPEVVFKYRHPDEQAAAAVDVRPKIAGKHRIKFKAEALPLKDRVGGYRLLYSHNCQFGMSQVHAADKLSMDTLLKTLPVLKSLKTDGGDRLKLVNEGIVEEVLLPLGALDFGKGQVGNCDIALWRTRGEHLPLVGEFAFQLKFPSRAALGAKTRRLAADFYLALQHEVRDWLALGVTKTAMVYRLKGNQPQSHE